MAYQEKICWGSVHDIFAWHAGSLKKGSCASGASLPRNVGTFETLGSPLAVTGFRLFIPTPASPKP